MNLIPKLAFFLVVSEMAAVISHRAPVRFLVGSLLEVLQTTWLASVLAWSLSIRLVVSVGDSGSLRAWVFICVASPPAFLHLFEQRGQTKALSFFGIKLNTNDFSSRCSSIFCKNIHTDARILSSHMRENIMKLYIVLVSKKNSSDQFITKTKQVANSIIFELIQAVLIAVI